MKYMNIYVDYVYESKALYAKNPHVEILMVCVSKDCQGKGYARKLVNFAKEKASERKIPLLFNVSSF